VCVCVWSVSWRCFRCFRCVCVVDFLPINQFPEPLTQYHTVPISTQQPQTHYFHTHPSTHSLSHSHEQISELRALLVRKRSERQRRGTIGPESPRLDRDLMKRLAKESLPSKLSFTSFI
jgi:hypothetical protein